MPNKIEIKSIACVLLLTLMLSSGTLEKGITKINLNKYSRLPKLDGQEQLDKLIESKEFVFVLFYDPEMIQSVEAMKHLLKIKRTKFFIKSKVRKSETISINIPGRNFWSQYSEGRNHFQKIQQKIQRGPLVV